MGADVVPSTEYRALADLAIAWTHSADTMDKSFANAVSTYFLLPTGLRIHISIRLTVPVFQVALRRRRRSSSSSCSSGSME